MSESILYKAKEPIGYEDFQRIFSLIKKNTWLENSDEGLYNLISICKDDKQKNLIEHLINNFKYTTSIELNKSGDDIANKITSEWNLKPDNTFIVAKCDDRKPDGSQAFLQSIKNKFPYEWSTNNFYNSILEAAHKIEDNSNVILIDDFIGTGETIKSKYKYLIKKFEERDLKNITVKIISFAAMNFSKTRLNQLTNVDYHSYIWLDKGISELIPNDNKQKEARKIMKEIESNLSSNFKNLKLDKHSLGYKESEALFNLEAYNIPNNVFPIFWWPELKSKEYHKTIFRRL